MFGRVGLRTLNLGVLFFAALGFCFVPLGKRTGWQHVRAILATDEAIDACRELGAASLRLRDSLLEAWDSGAHALPQAHIVPVLSPYAPPMQSVPGTEPRMKTAR